MMKTCLRFSKFSTKLKDVLLDILLNDASVHNALFRIICTTTQTLEVWICSGIVFLSTALGSEML